LNLDGTLIARSKVCVDPACTDGLLNSSETDVDCGGPDCAPCSVGATCSVGTDCSEDVCDATTNTCAAATCTDLIMNGDESAADCGGTTCPACGVIKRAPGFPELLRCWHPP